MRTIPLRGGPVGFARELKAPGSQGREAARLVGVSGLGVVEFFRYFLGMADDTVEIEYLLTLPNGEEKRHVVQLDRSTKALRPKPVDPLPEWTRLGFHQCPNCPLDPAVHSRCPVAVGLVEVVESFKNSVSHDVADVVVTTPNRNYEKRVSLQMVVSSLMGLHMASAGCPILDKLRPMVSTHLPFATLEETLYRTVSMYLLAQYFRWKNGLEPDWQMQDLVSTCDDLTMVNIAFGKRILNINTADASLNALASLDCFAGMTGLSISQDFLEEIEPLFGVYLRKNPSSDVKAS